MTKHKVLTETLEVLEDETEGTKVVFGDIVEALNHRGFGPLLMAPALLTILPTGAIPGIPALSALFICLVAGQILIGRRYPWMPKRLKKFSFKRQKLISAIELAKPYTTKIDRFIRPRLTFLSRKGFQWLIAAICCVLAGFMGLIGFVPLMPALISLPILFFAIGISSKDGIMTVCGFAFTLTAALTILMFSGVFGGEDKIKIGQPLFSLQPPMVIEMENDSAITLYPKDQP